jgi:Fe-S oxidoreductase
MWMEEKIGRRISRIRLEQLLETGAQTVAIGCPYCLIMLDDEIKAGDLGAHIKVLDLAQIVNGAVPD